DVTRHRAVLLRQPRDVEHRTRLPLHVRRHCDERAERDHTAAANAGNEDAVRAIESLRRRERETTKHTPFDLCRILELARCCAMNGDEARTKALEAGEIL